MRRSVTMVVASVAAVLSVAGCGSKSSTTSKSLSTTTTARSSSTTRFVIPKPTFPVDPCKLSEADISASIGAPVAKVASANDSSCSYDDTAKTGNPNNSVYVLAEKFQSETAAKSTIGFASGSGAAAAQDVSGFPSWAFAIMHDSKQDGSLVIDIGQSYVLLIQVRVYGRDPALKDKLVGLGHKYVG